MKKLISDPRTPREIPEERRQQCETVLNPRKPIVVLLIHKTGNVDNSQLINI